MILIGTCFLHNMKASKIFGSDWTRSIIELSIDHLRPRIRRCLIDPPSFTSVYENQEGEKLNPSLINPCLKLLVNTFLLCFDSIFLAD